MVTIFGSNNCLHCLKSKQMCEAMQIEHEYIDIYKDIDDYTLFRRTFPGAEGIPQILWKGEKLNGYNDLISKIDDFIINSNEGERDE